MSSSGTSSRRVFLCGFSFLSSYYYVLFPVVWILGIKKKFLVDTCPFVEPLKPLFLDFLSHLLWVSKPEWATLFALGGGVCDVCSLKFTSGVTPADLMVASILPTELCRLGLDGFGDLALTFSRK